MIPVEITRPRCPFVLFPILLAASFHCFGHSSTPRLLRSFLTARPELHVPSHAGSPLSQLGLPQSRLSMMQGFVFFITLSPLPAHSRCSVNIYRKRRKGCHLGYSYFNKRAFKNFFFRLRTDPSCKKQRDTNLVI